MNRSHLRNLSYLALVVIAAPLIAQESTGSLVGSIRTKTGEPVVGAQVRLTSPALQGVRVVTTDAKGAFRAALLPPGFYQVVATKDGYMIPRTTAEVGLGQVIRQDIIAGKATETTGAVVEVFAAAAAVDKTDVKASTNVTSEQLDVLPRTTRGLDTVALLSPGVTTNSAAGGRVTMRGGMTTGNRFLLNGTDIADNVFNDSTGRNYFVDDSIAETQVIQSPVHARFGNFTGGIVNAITKTGGNEFSGVFRTNLSRISWSAQTPRGLRPAVVPSNAGTNYAEDLRGAEHTLLVGGPILKDRLWFSLSTKFFPNSASGGTFSNPPTTTIYGSPAYIPSTVGTSYTRILETKFWEAKLTYAINSNHTLEMAMNKNKVTQTNRDTGGALEPNALYDSDNRNEYRTLTYRGVLGSNFNLEARYSKKMDNLGGGGDLSRPFPQRISGAYNNGSYYAINNGSFKKGAGDKRDTQTINANLTWFVPNTAVGTWTFDAGFEFLTMDRSAPNDQTPTGIRMFLEGINADRTYIVTNWAEDVDQWNTIELGFSDGGKATSQMGSYYLNAALAVNDHLQLMVGGRYDHVEAKDTLGSPNIKSGKFSPRFQATYDLFGDQAWLFRGSYAVYVGALHNGFTNKFTLAGNPVREWYGWGGATHQPILVDPANNIWNMNGATYAEVTNLANWAINANGFQGVGGASGNFVDSKLKAPSVDEYSFDIKHAFRDGSFMRITYVNRTFKDMYNDFLSIMDETGYTPKAAAGIGAVGSVATRWATDPRIKRDYRSVEFEFDARITSDLRFGGNYTYAMLRGNGEGGDSGGSNTGPVGDVLGNYDAVHTAHGRDVGYYAPYGYLNSDQRHRAGMHLDYVTRTKEGATFNASLMFNYAGGGAYSLTRTNQFEARNDAIAAGTTIAAQYPNTYTRFFGERGFGRFNDTFNCDFKMGVDVPVVSKLRYFIEATVFNVFNHWQLAGLSVDTQATATTYATDTAPAGYFALPWNTSATNRLGYGTYGPGSYVGGRSVRISTGLKW